MAREIKFRAWDKLKKEMVYNSTDEQMRCLFHDEPVCRNEDEKCKESNQFIGFPNNCPIFDYQQYTGLKDKNGKEIYEGDIVGEIGCAYKVEFGDGMFRLAHSTPLIDWIYSRKRQGIETEVIGNIYENPELIKEA